MAYLGTLWVHLADYIPEVANVQWLVCPFHVDISVFSSDSADIENDFLDL